MRRLGIDDKQLKPSAVLAHISHAKNKMLDPQEVYLQSADPKTERVAANISWGEMFGQIFRPMFIVMAFCMLLTASTELGPNQWQESVLKRTANVSGTLDSQPG